MRSARGRASAIISSAGAILLAALVPKCPLCIAAALSAWGLGAAAALAPTLRPLLLALAALALAGAEVQRRRARIARSCTSSCDGGGVTLP
jgi:hypothetical protein